MCKCDLGLSLIEVVVYIALCSVIMTSAVLVTYQLLQSAERTKRALQVTTEGNFILAKFARASFGAVSVQRVDDTTLEIERPDLESGSPIIFTEHSGVWYIQRGSGELVPISSSRALVHDVKIDVVSESPPSNGIIVSFYIGNTPFTFSSFSYDL